MVSRTVTFVTPSLEPLGNAGQLPLWAETLQGKGWTVSVIALHDPSAGDYSLRYPNVELHCLGLSPREWSRWREYFQLLAALRPSVLHFWDCSRRLGARSRRYADFQIETSFSKPPGKRGDWPWSNSEQPDLQLVYQSAEMRECQHTTSPSQDDQVDESSPQPGTITPGAGVQRVHKTPQRLLESRAMTRSRLSEQLGLEPDDKWIVGSARFSPETNCKGLIWGIDQLKIIRDDCHLLLLGEGPQQRQLERFLSLTEAGASTHFLGTRADGPEIVAAADIFWQADLTTYQPEGLLTALGCGIPVVSAYGPATGELALPQQTAWCARPEARYEFARWSKFFLEEAERTAQLSRQARRHIWEHFPRERVESEIEDIYRQR